MVKMLRLVFILFAIISVCVTVIVFMAKTINSKNTRINNLESNLRKQNEVIQEMNRIKEEGNELKESFSTGTYAERLDASLAVLSKLKAKQRKSTDN